MSLAPYGSTPHFESRGRCRWKSAGGPTSVVASTTPSPDGVAVGSDPTTCNVSGCVLSPAHGARQGDEPSAPISNTPSWSLPPMISAMPPVGQRESRAPRDQWRRYCPPPGRRTIRCERARRTSSRARRRWGYRLPESWSRHPIRARRQTGTGSRGPRTRWRVHGPRSVQMDQQSVQLSGRNGPLHPATARPVPRAATAAPDAGASSSPAGVDPADTPSPTIGCARVEPLDLQLFPLNCLD